ncbi:MAG TPA: class I SAM-dependent methyltransferase [Methylomirabilota bacterium]|jgi:SAM-dependent methyltransferase
MTSEATRSHDAGASAYDRFVGRWSRLYVPSLISAAGVAEGDSVLDVAAGTGEASVGLASLVGPAGRVLAVDLSRPMLSVAAGKVVGLPVRFAIMDGQRLACRSRSLDAVVCQLGLMFFAEPLRGLEEFARVLRPGGRIALQVWSRTERVPHYGMLAVALSRELPAERDELFRASAMADADRLQALLARAGFSDVSVTPERRSVAFDSFEDYWEAVEAGASRIGQFYLGLPPGRRRAVREEVERGMAPFRSGGRLTLEAEAFIGRGVRRGDR